MQTDYGGQGRWGQMPLRRSKTWAEGPEEHEDLSEHRGVLKKGSVPGS